jgi:hypothetical protein
MIIVENVNIAQSNHLFVFNIHIREYHHNSKKEIHHFHHLNTKRVSKSRNSSNFII